MDKIKIAIGSDHGGFDYKASIIKALQDKGYDIVDMGTYSPESCDYPIIAKKVARAVAKGDFEKGIWFVVQVLVCLWQQTR